MAEDPNTFAPWPGKITEYHSPGGARHSRGFGCVRWMGRPPRERPCQLAKVIAHAPTCRAGDRGACSAHSMRRSSVASSYQRELEKALLADEEVLAADG